MKLYSSIIHCVNNSYIVCAIQPLELMNSNNSLQKYKIYLNYNNLIMFRTDRVSSRSRRCHFLTSIVVRRRGFGTAPHFRKLRTNRSPRRGEILVTPYKRWFRQAQPPRAPEPVEGTRGTGGRYGRVGREVTRKRGVFGNQPQGNRHSLRAKLRTFYTRITREFFGYL